MYSTRDQHEMLDKIRVRENESKRINCPFCGGSKTFTVSRVNGALIWNCYKASCSAKGAKQTEMSAETMRRRMTSMQRDEIDRLMVPLPSILSDPSFHPRALQYLHETNSFDAYAEKKIVVKYAPAEDRVLFFTEDGYGATGRSLRGDKPKWKVYGRISPVIGVGDGDTCVIVEDVPSACNVGMIPNIYSCAILGTSINTEIKVIVSRFKSVLIMLDKDANRAAIRNVLKLQGRLPARMVFLEDDPKNIPRDELERKIK